MLLRTALTLSMLALASTSAVAQEKFPSHPIRMIVPYGPGGGTDITGRIVGQSMEKTLGTQILVENKPGANGLVGLQELINSRADGYTMILANQTVNVIAPLLYPNRMTFDPQKDLVPIARLATVPNVLVVNKDFPAKTFAELVDYAKKNPGKVRYTSTGVGSFPHFDMALLAKRAGVDMLHIPNAKGAAASTLDIIVGDAPVGMVNVATALPHVKSGNLRVLAVADKQRHPDYPNVPTLAEVGYPGVGTVQWFALLTQAKVPEPVIKALQDAALKAVNSPEIQQQFRQQGISADPTKTIEESKAWVAAEYDHWRQMIKEVPIQVER